MAGEVRIGGNTASVKLQGNDSITTDQTFTFPDNGGQLVREQQGTWTPGSGAAPAGTTAYSSLLTEIALRPATPLTSEDD